MSSVFAWVDEKPEQMEAIRKFLRSLDEGAIDLLGFLSLTEQFSEEFFPAITTIMTRARYFVFVPSALLAVEQSKLSGSRARDELERLENLVRDNLIKNAPDELGIIGKYAGEDLNQYPSDTYWGGIRNLGIFRRPWSKAIYLNRLRDFYAHAEETRENEKELRRERDSSESASIEYNWDPKFEDIRIDFNSSLSLTFDLRKREAEYLLRKYDEHTRDYGDSLIHWLLRRKTAVRGNEQWEEIKQQLGRDSSIDPDFRRRVTLAMQLRRMVQLCEQVYYVFLCRKKWNAVHEMYRLAHKHLAELLENKGTQQIVKTAERWLGEVCTTKHRAEYSFVSAVANELSSSNFQNESVVSSVRLYEIIAEREERKKFRKARLTYPEPLSSWATDSPYGNLPDYRRGIALRIAVDIRKALYA